VLFTSVNVCPQDTTHRARRSFQDDLLERLKALPGVESAAFGRLTPLSYGSFSSTPIAVDGYQPPPEEQPIVEYNEVGPDYFATIGIPLVSGREFTRADDEKAALIAIVNLGHCRTILPSSAPDLNALADGLRQYSRPWL